MQSALFDEPAGLPDGLAFVPEFIGREEERTLLEAIRALDLQEAQYKQYTAERRIASFGAHYDFDANELRPGTQLGWHRDVPQFESIVGVSLAADARMRFRPWPPRKGDALLALDLPPRSAYLLRGEVRWGWQHSVAPTKALRYSITFRTSAKGR